MQAEEKESVMRIEWKITKKRGNLRPLLIYSMVLEEHEKALALPPLRLRSTIPEPQDSWQEYCYPGCLERSGGPEGISCYDLESPSHRGKSWPQTLRLPWRENNAYPEVRASFEAFRDAFDALLAEACASVPMNEEESLCSGDEARRLAAPALLAERFLAAARRGCDSVSQ